MKLLIDFIANTYPSHELPNKSKVFILSPVPYNQPYVTIASITKEGYVNLMDKFVYQGRKGQFIRALYTTNRHIRVYLDNFVQKEVPHGRKVPSLLRKRKGNVTTKG